ncbi:MAG: (2Fe-2S)-binding protein [Porticoccaceae bacterium]
MYVCICKAVTEKQIRQEILKGACDYGELQLQLDVGTCCGQCRDLTLEILDETMTGHHEENVVTMWQPVKKPKARPALQVCG